MSDEEIDRPVLLSNSEKRRLKKAEQQKSIEIDDNPISTRTRKNSNSKLAPGAVPKSKSKKSIKAKQPFDQNETNAQQTNTQQTNAQQTNAQQINAQQINAQQSSTSAQAPIPKLKNVHQRMPAAQSDSNQKSSKSSIKITHPIRDQQAQFSDDDSESDQAQWNERIKQLELENQSLRELVEHFESMSKSTKQIRIHSPVQQVEQRRVETHFDPRKRTTAPNQHLDHDSPVQPQIIINTTNIDDLKFDGTTNVHDFIKTFKTKAQDLHWTDEHKRIKLRNCLVDYAALVYDKWEQSDKTSCDRIISRLRLDFGGDPTQFLTKFMSIMPKHDQSIKSYVAELYKVLKEAQAALDDTLQEGLIKSRLTANLASKAITLAAQEKSVSLLKYVELVETVMPKFDLNETTTTSIDTNKIVAQVLEQMPLNSANSMTSANYIDARPLYSDPPQYSNQYSNLHQPPNAPLQPLTNKSYQQHQYPPNQNQSHFKRAPFDNRRRGDRSGYRHGQLKSDDRHNRENQRYSRHRNRRDESSDESVSSDE